MQQMRDRRQREARLRPGYNLRFRNNKTQSSSAFIIE